MCARLLDEQLRAWLAQDPQRNLVAHRRRRQIHGLLVPEQLGAAALELEHRRVLTLLLVADLGARHRLAHRRGGLRLRVGTEVDHVAAI